MKNKNNTAQKMQFPDFIEKVLNESIQIKSMEKFFEVEDGNVIPPDYKDIAKIHLWNNVGKKFLDEFISNGGSDEYLLNEKEMEEIMQTTLTETLISSFFDLGFLNCVEDENGEMIVFPTEKLKNRKKHS